MRKVLLSCIVFLIASCSPVYADNRSQSSVGDVIATQVESTRVNRVGVMTEFLYRSMNKRQSREFIRGVVMNSIKLAGRHNILDHEMILAIISVESHFKPNAENNGSFGLMQVEGKSHPEKIRGRDIFNVYINMEVGSAIYLEYYKKYPDKRSALLSYNAGPANFRKGNFNEEYYTKVITVYNSLMALR